MRAPRMAALAVASVVGLGSVAALGSAAAPAYAADGDVMVSLDGTTFSSTVQAPLFDPALRVVPGDVIAESLWIRNASAIDARVRLDVLGAQVADQLFASALTLGARATDRPGTELPVAMADAGACSVVLRDVVLDAGETVRLDVTAAVGNLERQDGMNATATFDLRAVGVDQSVPTPADPHSCSEGPPVEPTPGPTEEPTEGPSEGPTDEPTTTPTDTTPPAETDDPDKDAGTLPITGTSPRLALGFAGMLVGAGVLVLSVRRRRKDQHSAS